MKRLVLVVAVAAVCSAILFAMSRSDGPRTRKETMSVPSETFDEEFAALEAEMKRLKEAEASNSLFSDPNLPTIESINARAAALEAQFNNREGYVEVEKHVEIVGWGYHENAKLVVELWWAFWAAMLGVIAFMIFRKTVPKAIGIGVVTFVVTWVLSGLSGWRLTGEADAVRYAVLWIPIGVLIYGGADVMGRKYEQRKVAEDSARGE